MRLSREDRSLVADWWFTIDRPLLAVLISLLGIGCLISLAASPAVAMKRGLEPFHFAERHLLFASVSLIVVLACSTLDPRQLRRLALLLLAASLVAMAWLAIGGTEIKGARRWVFFAGQSIQPSEFGKPALVLIVAWLLAEAAVRRDVPAMPAAILLALVFAGLLAIQPDIGQTVLIVAVWGGMFLVSGQPLKWALLLVPAGIGGFGAAYLSFEHVRRRVARFLDPGSGENYQIERAVQSFAEGGIAGRGPGEGVIKSTLPDAHTDFIFAVIGEEYGAIACLGLLALYGFVALRALGAAFRTADGFLRLAATGLCLLLVGQAAINMGVNVGLLPAKGMTLPFVSAGGSSTLSSALTAGFLLAATRRRVDAANVKKPQLATSLGRLSREGA